MNLQRAKGLVQFGTEILVFDADDHLKERKKVLYRLWMPRKNKGMWALFLISCYLLQAVSIFIDMDESGARANEWIYK